MVLHYNLGPDLIFNSPDKLETYDFVIFCLYFVFATLVKVFNENGVTLTFEIFSIQLLF